MEDAKVRQTLAIWKMENTGIILLQVLRSRRGRRGFSPPLPRSPPHFPLALVGAGGRPVLHALLRHRENLPAHGERARRYNECCTILFFLYHRVWYDRTKHRRGGGRTSKARGERERARRDDLLWADKEKRRERKRGKERGEKSGLLFLLSARLMVLLLLLRKKVRMIVASAVLDSVSLLRWRRILLHSFVDERKGFVRRGWKGSRK